MALTTAVVLEIPGTRQRRELFEYPGEVEELDDMVLEHLITDGRPYKLRVGNSVITQQILEDHTQRAAVLNVSVVVDAPRAAIVLKRVDVRPVQKCELVEFPEDMDELDDIVLNSLITDGSDFVIRVDGDVLTADKFAEHKDSGKKLVVHVSRSGPSSGPPSSSGWSLASAPQVRSVDPGPRPAGGCPEAQRKMQEVQGLRDKLAAARQTTYSQGANVLVVTVEAEAELFKTIKKNTEAVEVANTELGIAAKGLVKEMTCVFDIGLTETLATRKTISNMRKLTSQLGDALVAGKFAEVHQYMLQCQNLANKLETRSRHVRQMIEGLQQKLLAKIEEYGKSEEKYRSVQRWSTGGAVTSGFGAGTCGVGLATVGLMTEAVPAVAAGWFSAGVAAVPAAVNPVGLALLAGCGIFTVVAAMAGSRASSAGAAKVQTGKMHDITTKAEKVGSINEELWNGVSKHLSVAVSAVEDLSNFSPEQVQLFGDAFVDMAKSLTVIEDAVDEYLVYLSTKQIYPINFSVESVVGLPRYKQIKDRLSVTMIASTGCAQHVEA